jgi:hypothetical protein
MAKLAQRVKGRTVKYCDPASQTHTTREGWMLAEFLRRTIVVLYTIEFLLDRSPGMGYGSARNGTVH